MVAPNFPSERPYVSLPSTLRPPRNQNSMHWSAYANGRANDQPPAPPPKDPNYAPVPFPSQESTSPSPRAQTRQRHTSLSVYETQSTSLASQQSQPPKLPSRRSFLGLASLLRHRSSKSDTGLAASTTSLSRPESNRQSYAATVFTPSHSVEYSCDSSQPVRTPSS